MTKTYHRSRLRRLSDRQRPKSLSCPYPVRSLLAFQSTPPLSTDRSRHPSPLPLPTFRKRSLGGIVHLEEKHTSPAFYSRLLLVQGTRWPRWATLPTLSNENCHWTSQHTIIVQSVHHMNLRIDHIRHRSLLQVFSSGNLRQNLLDSPPGRLYFSSLQFKVCKYRDGWAV